MSRSYNSRKGFWTYKTWDKESYDLIRRSKKSRKRNIFKFDDVLYTTSKQHKKREKRSKQTGKDWHYITYIEPMKGSYQNWTWLKGKANQKGWNPVRHIIYWDDAKRTFYPCQ